jgi:hypothetical protein
LTTIEVSIRRIIKSFIRVNFKVNVFVSGVCIVDRERLGGFIKEIIKPVFDSGGPGRASSAGQS